MDFIVPKFIRYQLYLLQLENYELGRYWKLLFKKGPWPRGEQRKELVWSVKAKAMMLMAVALHGFVIIFSGLITVILTGSIGNFFVAAVIAAIILSPFYFLLFSVVLLLLKPFDSLAKKRLAIRAKSKIGNMPPDLKIIGVAGSYGKTTMKEVLGKVLGIRFKVLATPDSVNTPVGIARWILNKVTDETQVLIVEMGEHYAGDIGEICDIAKPNIAVVTGINESHLERMKNMETVASTIFEIVSGSEPGAVVLLNADDKRVMDNYKKFIWPDHKVEKYSAKGGSAFGGQISNIKYQKFNTEKLCWEAELESFGKIEVNLLGEYALGDVDAAVKIGKNLGMSDDELKRGITNIKPVEHRLQPIKSAGEVLVIDDAYNGNPDGVGEAIKVLSRFTNRRKIYITPGLVEMGNSSAEVHRQIGRELAGVADVAIFIRNSVTGFVEEGIQTSPSRFAGHPSLPGGEAPRLSEKTSSSPPFQGGVPASAGEVVGVKKPQIIWFDSALEAHAGLKNILKPGDVVMFQNDWGDQYI
ncbi:MAG: UDP-N-acetylmuramoyl-tripeptide--D-alanyl-D-alanine ligase [Candidatus Doudnabacteria bacterium]|nr:UDP-N-acetylmuramoyl-tripeptide--D-alanyl-D-alanine ligase [Candidatus Doudnabacteria bacterium]